MNPSSAGRAFEWVARITSVALMMVLPGIAGWWLDNWLGTTFLSAIGFGLGLAVGLSYLLTMVRTTSATSSDSNDDADSSKERIDE